MVTHPESLPSLTRDTGQGLWKVRVNRQLLPTSQPLDVHFSPDAAALEDAVENSHDCITLVDMQGHVLFMNLPGLWQMELEGDPAEQHITWPELWPRECVDLAEYSMESARSGRACRFTAHRLTSRGAAKWWDVAVSPIFDRRGDPVQMFCVSRDITELKQTESSLQRALAEKEVLLHEVNHRIKNGLAAIAGVLSLQARHSQDVLVHNCLQQAQSRVIAVAEIHRRLYEMAGHDSLDIGDCIADVARGTLATLDPCSNVELHTACERGIEVKSDQAITLALVISELITNCVKHAFQGASGKIRVALAAGPTQLSLQVNDNGRGFPADFNREHSAGVGMRIVHGLVRQLHGELRIENAAPGARFSIVFPRETDEG